MFRCDSRSTPERRAAGPCSTNGRRRSPASASPPEAGRKRLPSIGRSPTTPARRAEISILIEADNSNAICECSGTNNTLCAGPLAISFPDLVVSGISFAGLSCAVDAISGSVAVTVTNQGCGAANAFNVGLATSGCLTFSSQRVTSLAAGSSVVVQFPVATAWSGCGTCACTFTATVDTGQRSLRVHGHEQQPDSSVHVSASRPRDHRVHSECGEPVRCLVPRR